MSTMAVQLTYESTVTIEVSTEVVNPRRVVAPKAAKWLLRKYVLLQRWAQSEFSTPGGSIATIASRGVGVTTPVEAAMIHRAAVVDMLSKTRIAIACLLPYERRAIALFPFQDNAPADAAFLLDICERTLWRWWEDIAEKVSLLLDEQVTQEQWRAFSRAADYALGEEP